MDTSYPEPAEPCQLGALTPLTNAPLSVGCGNRLRDGDVLFSATLQSYGCYYTWRYLFEMLGAAATVPFFSSAPIDKGDGRLRYRRAEKRLS